MDATEKPLQIDFGSDEQEIHRLAIQHEVMKSAFPSLILAPIDLSRPGLKILDSATADGMTPQSLFCNKLTRKVSGFAIFNHL